MLSTMTKNNKKAFYFLVPSLIFAILFLFYPIIKTLILSFITPKGELGLNNYEYVFGLDTFHIALKNTIIYASIVTFLEMIIALLISFALSQKIKAQNFFQTIFFLPYVTSVIAIGAVFKIMYHTNYGIINQVLNNIGIDSVGWLTDPKFVIWAVIILGIWKGLAFNILIIFTGLATTNQEVEKAALIDGFSPMQTFIKIKLPQIKPILAYLLTMNLIFNLKVYEEIVSLFGTVNPGPGSSASSLVYMLYKNTLSDPSVAAVISVVLLVVVIGLRLLADLMKKVIR